jgi:hypothetical protein
MDIYMQKKLLKLKAIAKALNIRVSNKRKQQLCEEIVAASGQPQNKSPCPEEIQPRIQSPTERSRLTVRFIKNWRKNEMTTFHWFHDNHLRLQDNHLNSQTSPKMTWNQ